MFFSGSQLNVDKFFADNFPVWDEVTHIDSYRGAVSDFIDELGSVYSLDVSHDESICICFERKEVNDIWFEEINQKLTAIGLTEIDLDYADENGECAGYMEFSGGVFTAEHYKGEDISEISAVLLGVLRTWNTMSYLFDDADNAQAGFDLLFR